MENSRGSKFSQLAGGGGGKKKRDQSVKGRRDQVDTT